MIKKKMQKGGSKKAAKMRKAFKSGPMSQSMLSPKQKRKINRAAKKGPIKSPVKGPKMQKGGKIPGIPASLVDKDPNMSKKSKRKVVKAFKKSARKASKAPSKSGSLKNLNIPTTTPPKMKGGGEALFKSLAGKMGKSKSMKLLEQMTKGGMMDMSKPMEMRMGGMGMDYMKRGGRVATNRKTKMMRGGMKGKKKR